MKRKGFSIEVKVNGKKVDYLSTQFGTPSQIGALIELLPMGSEVNLTIAEVDVQDIMPKR